mgnify:CR=1 FL=1
MTILLSVPTYDGIVLVSDMRVSDYRSANFSDTAEKLKRVHSHCLFGTVGSPIYSKADGNVDLDLIEIVSASLSTFSTSNTTLANPHAIKLDLLERLESKVHGVKAEFNQETQFLVYEFANFGLVGHYFNIMLHRGRPIEIADDPVVFNADPFRDLVHGWTEKRLENRQIPYEVLKNSPSFKLAWSGNLLTTADALALALTYFKASIHDPMCRSVSPTLEAISLTKDGISVEVPLGTDISLCI